MYFFSYMLLLLQIYSCSYVYLQQLFLTGVSTPSAAHAFPDNHLHVLNLSWKHDSIVPSLITFA